MSTAPSGYSTPYTTWTSNDGIANTDLNRIEDNTEAIETGDRTLSPAEPDGNTGNLRELLDWFAYAIKGNRLYGSNWYGDGGSPWVLSGRYPSNTQITDGNSGDVIINNISMPNNTTLYLRRLSGRVLNSNSPVTNAFWQVYNATTGIQYQSSSGTIDDNVDDWIYANNSGSTALVPIQILLYNNTGAPLTPDDDTHVTAVFTLESGYTTTTTTTTTTGAP